MGFWDKNNKPFEKEEDGTEQSTENNMVEDKTAAMPKRRPYAIWEVGGKEIKLKLTTDGIERLEKKYKTNLMNVMGAGNGGMPALTVMLDVTHEASKKFEHGITRQDMSAIFEKYIEEGGSQLNFYTEIYMQIFQVSGFFSNSLTDQMQEALDEAGEIMQ